MKKNILIVLGIVLGFLVLSYAYAPEVLSGKVVNQSDISGWRGMVQEKIQWDKEHPDDPALWSGSMFSGMPTVSFSSRSKGDLTNPVYCWVFGIAKRPVSFFFVALLGAFLLLLALGLQPLIAAGGAVAVAFCSYNMQIIQVGHNTKMMAIALMTWVLAALVFTYRKALQEGLSTRRRLACIALGAALFGLTVSFQVKANHPQISYYLAMTILIYVVVLFVWMLVHKVSQKYFWIASVLLLVLGLGGLATNAVEVMPTWEYTPYSIRGGSTASNEDGEAKGGSKGLDIAYATSWSYGWEELPNLLIPNYNGGSSSSRLSLKSNSVQYFRKAGQGNLLSISKGMPTYWGPQPFTAGPMYMGAITIFLFIFGLLYWKGREKWWIVITTLLALLLSLGYHFLWLTKLFFVVMPLYNKFRTVSMILVLLQVMLPVLGFLMLDKIVKDEADTKVLRSRVLNAAGITVGLIVILASLQSLFGSFVGPDDAGSPEAFIMALASDRVAMLWTDTARSLVLVIGAAALLFWGVGKKPRRLPAALLVCVLVIADLFLVGKRYLNHDSFIEPKDFNSQFDKRPVDEYILLDEDQSYRVADITSSVFNDSHASYWHKSIGGYSPAKLQRYQEYVEAHLKSELASLLTPLRSVKTIEEAEEVLPYMEGLASLNCRYIIISGNTKPLRYKYARGNAWYEDGSGRIELDHYTPNRLSYSFSSPAGGKAVFSEVYYPAGWVARLSDGTELPIGLYAGGTDELGPVAGGLLRCIDLPAGDGKLTMSFEPKSYARGEAVSRASSLLLILLLLASVVFMVVPEKISEKKQ
ncbi:MAG: hypothetical protein IKZ91_03820 [Bacteroidales bacterium]|nr:hypothetical protein [Bacteroidales bacterium]